MGDAVLGLLVGVTPLVSQVASKRGLSNKKECTSTEILQVSETLSIISPQRGVGGTILIKRGKRPVFF